jgi:DNA-directed RNA polymerase subunit M/transcription elongation factor TFIIS
MINTIKRNNNVKELSKKFSLNIAIDIENSIYQFSNKYANDNCTLFLLNNIYDSKIDEILCILTNKNLEYLIQAIKKNKINPKKFAFMKPEELNFEKYVDIIKKKEVEKMREENANVSNAFECKKCKKNRCSVIERQIRSGDEPATLFITCLECSNVTMM